MFSVVLLPMFSWYRVPAPCLALPIPLVQLPTSLCVSQVLPTLGAWPLACLPPSSRPFPSFQRSHVFSNSDWTCARTARGGALGRSVPKNMTH
ncbi:hypothetical protein FKM82_018310 [Ascaphus truei]